MNLGQTKAEERAKRLFLSHPQKKTKLEKGSSVAILENFTILA